MIVLGVLTDGRADYLAQTMEAVHRLGTFDFRFIVDDTGDSDYTKWLRESYPGWRVHAHHERRGLAGAVQSVWEYAIAADADYLFHLEDDWVFLEDIDVRAACDILAAHQDVAQMLFKRQPLLGHEIAAGDILGGMGTIDAHVGWVTQQAVFSLNPCVIPRWVLELGWPTGNEAEMTQRLVRAGARFGVWGDPGSAHPVFGIGPGNRSPDWKL